MEVDRKHSHMCCVIEFSRGKPGKLGCSNSFRVSFHSTPCGISYKDEWELIRMVISWTAILVASEAPREFKIAKCFVPSVSGGRFNYYHHHHHHHHLNRDKVRLMSQQHPTAVRPCSVAFDEVAYFPLRYYFTGGHAELAERRWSGGMDWT